MRVLVENSSGASSVAIRGVAVTALVVGAALFPPFCHAEDIAYGYDALGRLTSVTVAGATAYYDYDVAGNMTGIRRQGALSSAGNAYGADGPPHSSAETLPDSAALAQAATR